MFQMMRVQISLGSHCQYAPQASLAQVAPAIKVKVHRMKAIVLPSRRRVPA